MNYKTFLKDSDKEFDKRYNKQNIVDPVFVPNIKSFYHKEFEKLLELVVGMAEERSKTYSDFPLTDLSTLLREEIKKP